MARNEGPPDWMREEYRQQESRGNRAQVQSYVKTDLSSLHAEERLRDSAFPKSVVTGVKIIAWLMLLNTSIGAAFVVVSMFPPRGTELGFGTVVTFDDYFTFGRMLISLILGVLLAIGIWKIVDSE